MLATTSGPEAGRRLRAERKRLRLSTRDVERLSQAIARKRNDPQYYISHTWVADLERGKFRPKLCKLRTLSLIYKCSLQEILSCLGLDIDQASNEQGLVSLPHTCILPATADSTQTIAVPVALRENAALEHTNLVSRMFEKWGDVPIVMLRQLNWRNTLYGYIGTEDYTLFPFLRPGSLVLIDPRQRKIQPEGWRNEFERPIYFVELRDDYVCSWCEVSGSQLVLIPSAHSGKQARHVRYPGDAEVLGRVTAVTMSIANIRGS